MPPLPFLVCILSLCGFSLASGWNLEDCRRSPRPRHHSARPRGGRSLLPAVRSAEPSETTPPPSFGVFSHNPPPYLVLVTESDACDSDERLNRTLQYLRSAALTGQVDLVSVRLRDNHRNEVFEDGDSARRRARQLVQQLADWSSQIDAGDGNGGGSRNRRHRRFGVVLSSSQWRDDPEIAAAVAHGVHFKESHRPDIPGYRESRHRTAVRRGPTPVMIGTSCHSVESALQALEYNPDYLFVGTCYPTPSHPEKQPDQVEGPGLPGRVRLALIREERSRGAEGHSTLSCPSTVVVPPVVAIGGIDASNCGGPIALGADGVAVIRAVSEAADPAQAVRDLRQALQRAWQARESTP